MLRAALTFVAFGIGLSAGCYSERLPPPAYRYPCDSDLDCDQGESCVLGLCEFRCSTATFETDCPSDGSYLACINGLCANGCEVGTDTCPDLTECIDLSALGISVGGSSNPFGGSSNTNVGVCGRMCEVGGDSCPGGEVCILGFCTPECDPEDPAACPEGLACLPDLGVCGPPAAAGDSGGSATNGSDSMTGTGSDSAGTTGGA